MMRTSHKYQGLAGHLAGGLLMGLVVLGLGGCSSNIRKVENTTERFYRKGFSMLPPQEAGWKVKDDGDNDDESEITFLKKGIAPKSSYVVIASSSSHSLKFKSEEEFEAVMGKLRIDMEFRPKRNVLLEKKVSLASETGKYCLRTYTKMKDFGTNGDINDRYLLMENYGLICLHPEDRTQLVNFAVSYRYPPGAEDKEMKARAEKILAGVQLEPLHDNSSF